MARIQLTQGQKCCTDIVTEGTQFEYTLVVTLYTTKINITKIVHAECTVCSAWLSEHTAISALIQRLLVGSYNRDGEGLLRGTGCVFNKTITYS